MAVTFWVPGPLREQTEGRSQVEVETAPATVAEALAALWRECPGLRDRILDEQGQVRRHINIFVGEENIRDCRGFATAVKNGTTITIVPAVSGGRPRFITEPRPAGSSHGPAAHRKG